MNCSTTGCCATSVFEELDRGLNRLMRSEGGSDVLHTSDDPRLSLHEFDNRYVVECDLPGVAMGDISLQVEDHVLSINARRKSLADDGNGKVLFNERPRSEFACRLQLPREIDQNSIDAELAAGVLRITVSKRAEVLPRKIEIRRTGSQSA